MKYRPSTHWCLLVLVLLSRTVWAQTGEHPADDSQTEVKRELPIPSGRYSIGRQAIDLPDNEHPGSSWSTSAKRHELMIYIWYPAQPSLSKNYAEYFPSAAEIDQNPEYEQVAQEIFGTSWPMIVDGSIHSHALTDAQRVVGEQFPVVLFFPGYSSTTFSYTAQIENLVSYGYVVIAVEDTNISGMVRFSDGHIELLQEPPPRSSHSPPLQAMIASAKQGTQIGAEQVRYVLNALQKSTPLSRIMNLSKVGVVGHSAGGTLAARACQIDSGIKVCISEDGEVNPVGAFFDYPDHSSMHQPFLFIQVEHNPTDEELARMHESPTQWGEFLAHEQGQLNKCGKASLFIRLHRPGMTHSSFSDGPVLNARDSEQAGIARANLRLTEELEKAFLDKYLRGVSTSMLDNTEATPQGMAIEHIGK